MTISYKWLKRHLPLDINPEKLSKILTSIGLEVEKMETYSAFPGGLAGLVCGEVLTCDKHEGADKLKVTTVNVGAGDILQIVCGAANVAAGQKVIVALVGTTIHPVSGDPFTIKKAKIRGVESMGMICAEDEIGIGKDHSGIIILPQSTPTGTAVSTLYDNAEDVVYEIGLTPNRMDAMSHAGVAKDVVAYLNHHEKANIATLKNKVGTTLKSNTTAPVKIQIENAAACSRYAGAYIENVTVSASPAWLQHLLKAIGIQPINNIVDATNFILHDTGQPLHAFDANQIDSTIRIKNLPAGTVFKTLDGVDRKLLATDLMICDGTDTPLCLAGVYGGMHSGVQPSTKNIFLESAFFAADGIRKTSLKHGLRTEAASRFEKTVNIAATADILQEAVNLITELAGGQCTSIQDIYPAPKTKTQIILKYFYLKKLSGKNYAGDSIKNILTQLGFEIVKDSPDALTVDVPFSKPDITHPADVVEEIMRIDGLDNITIQDVISIAPSAQVQHTSWQLQEKIANQLAGAGFREMFTNSITNSKYYNSEANIGLVKMINNLSADLDVMRPQMLQTGLEVVAHNLNRKNQNLLFFEFGKVYQTTGDNYLEKKELSLFATGSAGTGSWAARPIPADHYFLKSVCQNILQACGIANSEQVVQNNKLHLQYQDQLLCTISMVEDKTLDEFGVKEPVAHAVLAWDTLLLLHKKVQIKYSPIPKYPAVQRDIAIIVNKQLAFGELEKTLSQANVSVLQSVRLFDIFESEKLGPGKKSMAVNLTFQHDSKTLEEKEIDTMMQKLIKQLETKHGAELRK